ncbi:MAG: head GIN domain-containing protein [Bacteroidota bacterium]
MKQIVIPSFLSVLLLVIGNFSVYGQRTETRSLDHFDAIVFQGAIDAVVVQGKEEKINIETKGKVHPDEIVTKVKNGSLYISQRSKRWFRGRITVYISCRELQAIQMVGAGDVHIKGLTTKKLKFVSTGSGDIQLEDLNATSLAAQLSGSGDMQISGQADEQNFVLNGSGDVDAGSLKGKHIDVMVSGSGDVRVHAQESIHAVITGSGDITYKGNPAEREIHTTGSGDVRGTGIKPASDSDKLW